MTICERFPFISVNPDPEVCCSCHGEGLVEVKCQATLIGKIPNYENYSTHKEQQNDSIYLKKLSPYYYYFFVFTFQGRGVIPPIPRSTHPLSQDSPFSTCAHLL